MAQGASRATVALDILGSGEGQEGAVRGGYRHFLNREADSHGLEVFTGALHRGVSSHELVIGILSSEEYFMRA
jgi:hypothetical protein